ncbi:MAG: hypothetical protein Q8S33_16680 [Myxococcales bacterium]|nr:hypothetical protein [Myxococcales bacterium]
MLNRRLLRVIALAVATAVLSTGCMLSRAVDRAFLGLTVRRPSFDARKTTGIFLLPITFAIDIATFPIQALLVVILGDNFPFKDTEGINQMYALNQHPQLQKLSPERRAIAMKEFERLIGSGQLDRNTTLALTDEGEWVMVKVGDEARQQMLARAQAPEAVPEAVCER